MGIHLYHYCWLIEKGVLQLFYFQLSLPMRQVKTNILLKLFYRKSIKNMRYCFAIDFFPVFDSCVQSVDLVHKFYIYFLLLMEAWCYLLKKHSYCHNEQIHFFTFDWYCYNGKKTYYTSMLLHFI